MDVKSIIKEKGFTIEQVVKEMGISRVTFTQNLSRNPTMRTLQRIADVLGCKVGDFFKDEIDPHTTLDESRSSYACSFYSLHTPNLSLLYS